MTYVLAARAANISSAAWRKTKPRLPWLVRRPPRKPPFQHLKPNPRRRHLHAHLSHALSSPGARRPREASFPARARRAKSAGADPATTILGADPAHHARTENCAGVGASVDCGRQRGPCGWRPCGAPTAGGARTEAMRPPRGRESGWNRAATTALLLRRRNRRRAASAARSTA